MSKLYYSLGLMSGTSGDGVDASIIQSDGDTKYKVILNKYFGYNQDIYGNIHNLNEKIKNSRDLKKLLNEINALEKKITLFHADIVNQIIKNTKLNIELVGFHGQTIFHNDEEKISKQLGDGKLLSNLTKKIVIYNFRQNDLKNGGRGAPLTPIFHKLIAQQNKIPLPVCILNLGGIANITAIKEYDYKDIFSCDIGPGNCLIDQWIRKNSNKKYDNNGLIAKSGKIDKEILDKAFEKYRNKKKLSLHTKDFDLSFVKNLSFEDGAATLTYFTSKILFTQLLKIFKKEKNKLWKVLVCGGGRKNNTLIQTIKDETSNKLFLQPIDDYNVDGDFVESQAFAYLAIRSFINLPISYPQTTGVLKPSSGGMIVKI
jgi:anhydro-N-acetylmuramic acid kinase